MSGLEEIADLLDFRSGPPNPSGSPMPDAARLRVPARGRGAKLDRLALNLEALILARLKARLALRRATRALGRDVRLFEAAQKRMRHLARVEETKQAAWMVLSGRSALADVTEARGRLRGILGDLLGTRP